MTGSRPAVLGDRRRLIVLGGLDHSRERCLGFAKLKLFHGTAFLCDYMNYCSLDPASNRDDPHEVKTNVRIAVDKTVSHAHYLAPRDFGMGGPCGD